jgi:phosphogluconate dehydratase
MSGASGSVLTVVHVTPETKQGGIISKIQNSDIIEIDAQKGTMNVNVSNDDINKRQTCISNSVDTFGYGRELFKQNRSQVSSSETGAISIG